MNAHQFLTRFRCLIDPRPFAQPLPSLKCPVPEITEDQLVSAVCTSMTTSPWEWTINADGSTAVRGPVSVWPASTADCTMTVNFTETSQGTGPAVRDQCALSKAGSSVLFDAVAVVRQYHHDLANANLFCKIISNLNQKS